MCRKVMRSSCSDFVEGVSPAKPTAASRNTARITIRLESAGVLIHVEHDAILGRYKRAWRAWRGHAPKPP
jgi:hypothetical protein